MDYQQSRAYVKDADRYAGGALDLTNIKELMKRLGNPQDQLKYVHVAATLVTYPANCSLLTALPATSIFSR